MPKFVLLWTDAAIWLLVVALGAYIVHVRRTPNLAATWRKVFADAPALASAVVLIACMAVTLLDSVHYRSQLASADGTPAGGTAYDTRTRSLMDGLLSGLVESRETTYSRPLAYESFTKESVEVGGQVQRVAPRLLHGGAQLQAPATQWAADVTQRGLLGLVAGLVAAAALCAALVALLAPRAGVSWRDVSSTAR